MVEGYCTKCGAPIENKEAIFCEKCGKQLYNENNLNTTAKYDLPKEEDYGNANIYNPPIEENHTNTNRYNPPIEENHANTNRYNPPIEENRDYVKSYNSPVREGHDNIRYHKNKYLAVILSIIPGIGQMYNGQILKGTIIAFLLFILNVIFDYFYNNDNISGPLAIMIVIVYFYNLFDAYKTANDINKYNGNYFYTSDNKYYQEHYHNKKNSFHEFESEVSSYFHEETPDGKKSVSLLRVTLFIIVLYIIILYFLPG